MCPGCRLLPRARNLRGGVMDRLATMAATIAATMVQIMEPAQTPRELDQVSKTVLRRTSQGAA